MHLDIIYVCKFVLYVKAYILSFHKNKRVTRIDKYPMQIRIKTR